MTCAFIHAFEASVCVCVGVHVCFFVVADGDMLGLDSSSVRGCRGWRCHKQKTRTGVFVVRFYHDMELGMRLSMFVSTGHAKLACLRVAV